MHYLYRGMSNLEFEAWETERGFTIPRKKNVTEDPQEAVDIGKRWLRDGSLLVLAVRYDPLLFAQTTSGEPGERWYETDENISLGSVEWELLTPGQAYRKTPSRSHHDVV